MMITRVGLDIAKQVFQVHGVDERGRARLRKQLARAKVLEFFVQIPPCLIGIAWAILTHGTHYRPAGPELVAA
jgi:transposase